MSLYTPFQLVHAHLPAPPSGPSAVPEVVLQTEGSFSPTEEDFNSPLHPDHAMSASFDPRTATLARAVLNGYALELRSLSPVISTARQHEPSSLRIVFPEKLRNLADGCVVPSIRARQLVVLAVTEANVLYRFSFPLGSFVDKSDRISFNAKDAEWCEEWGIDQELITSAGAVGTWAVTNEDTIILGCADGGIIKVQRSSNSTPDRPQWTETYHRGGSRLRIGSLWSRHADEAVTSIAEFQYEDQIPVLYTFSRDHKLRTWSVLSGNCLKTFDVRSSSQDLVPRSPSSQPSSASIGAPDTTSSLIRVIAHPNPSRYSHVVVVFVPTPYNPTVPGTFIFYRASNTAHAANDLVYAGEKQGSTASAGSELRGFEIQPPTRTDAADGWRLWAVWDAKGSLAAESVPINDILQFSTFHEPQAKPPMVWDWQRAATDADVEHFDTSYFDTLLSLDAPDAANPLDNSDISDVFVEHLFHPGRFSTLTLSTALREHLEQLPVVIRDRLDSAIYPSLAAKFKATIGAALEMETSPQTGAPVVEDYRRSLKQEWLGVWARARELDKQARWPVATSSLNGQLLVLDRDGAAAPIQEDATSVLVRLGATPLEANEFQTLPEGSLLALYPALAPPQKRRALTGLAVAGEGLSATLSGQTAAEDTGTALDALLSSVNAELSHAARVPVEDLGESMWSELVNPYLSDDIRADVQRALAEATSVVKTISDALDILATFSPFSSSEQKAETWSYAGFGNTLLASAISDLIAARFAFARDVLLVALWHLSQVDIDDEDDEIFEVTARALATYHRYRVLHWLAQQTGAEAGERARARRQAKRLRGKDDVLLEFDSLKMRENEDEPSDSDGYDTAYSLLHALLARTLPQPVPKDTVACLFDSASNFLADVDLVTTRQVDLEPRPSDTKLAYAVLADGHASSALELAELYPRASGLEFVRGRALLELGRIDECAESLERASVGCRDGSLKAILPTCDGKAGLGEYYRRVMALVDGHGFDAAVAHFGTLALQSIEMGDSTTRDIWTRVFLAHLELGQYEDAYATLTTAPFNDIKRDLLGQLISAMCEMNEVGRLNSLGFIGFQKDVEQQLAFKARNSDPLRTPNYYRVLYSWHISRGDYRSAGEIMYAQGQRYGEVSGGKLPSSRLAAMRAQSYLAAINALSLVDKRNAWIAVHVATSNTRSEKRRRTTKYIPEAEFTPDNRPVDIVTLDDMRAAYIAVLGQLELSQQIPEMVDNTITLSPEELVGFFVQRSLFDRAQTAASEMDVDMTHLFETLATRCVELARTGAARDAPSATFLLASPVTARLRGPTAALALRYLQVALERHDGPKTEWRYTSAVAETFFAQNRDARSGWAPPPWLVDSELKRDPEGWIARALAHGWVKEAIGWCADTLRRVTPPDMLPKGKSDVVDVPYNLIDRVLAAAQDGDEKDDADVQAAAKALQDAVRRRIDGTRKMCK